jgi:hypothetical protein
MIIYGLVASISIGKLFLGGVLPGLMLSTMFIAYVLIRCALNPSLGPPLPEDERARWSEKFIALRGVILPILLVIGVLGSIFSGIATPTEAAAVGAAGSIVCAAVYRRLNLEILIQSAFMTLRVVAMVVWIIFGAMFFAAIYSGIGATKLIQTLLTEWDVSPWVVLIVMQAIWIVLGSLMEALSVLLITAPVFIPVSTALGFDPLWFGVDAALRHQPVRDEGNPAAKRSPHAGDLPRRGPFHLHPVHRAGTGHGFPGFGSVASKSDHQMTLWRIGSTGRSCNGHLDECSRNPLLSADGTRVQRLVQQHSLAGRHRNSGLCRGDSLRDQGVQKGAWHLSDSLRDRERRYRRNLAHSLAEGPGRGGGRAGERSVGECLAVRPVPPYSSANKETPGFVAAARYVIKEPLEGRGKYLAIYEIETDDIEESMRVRRERKAEEVRQGKDPGLWIAVWGSTLFREIFRYPSDTKRT